jgi:hypothetical protein
MLRADHRPGESVGIARRERMLIGVVDEHRRVVEESTVHVGDTAGNIAHDRER